MVRAFAHDAMSRRIDPSRGEPIELFLVQMFVELQVDRVGAIHRKPCERYSVSFCELILQVSHYPNRFL